MSEHERGFTMHGLRYRVTGYDPNDPSTHFDPTLEESRNMPATMRAKMAVRVADVQPTQIVVAMTAVTGQPFGPDGESEDNTYARWTPFAELHMTITNPALFGKLRQGDTFYVDFTPVEG